MRRLLFTASAVMLAACSDFGFTKPDDDQGVDTGDAGAPDQDSGNPKDTGDIPVGKDTASPDTGEPEADSDTDSDSDSDTDSDTPDAPTNDNGGNDLAFHRHEPGAVQGHRRAVDAPGYGAPGGRNHPAAQAAAGAGQDVHLRFREEVEVSWSRYPWWVGGLT